MVETSYPDVSSAQAGMSLAGASVVCAKVTEGIGYANPFYDVFRGQANVERALFFAYHFLHEGQPEAQAAWCRRHAGLVPLMVDCEPEEQIRSFPSFADLTRFVDEYRRLGGICHLGYLPHWYWSSPTFGAPSLAPLIQRRMALVSSDYVAAYSDDGPGWGPYGGMTPAVWQWTSSAHFNGRLVDRNVFKGPVAQLRELITTGSITPVKPAAPAADEEEEEMQLLSGDGGETIISFLRGSKTWAAFACDASRTKSPAPVLRVAVHSYTKGMSQVENVTMPVSGKHTVSFAARDVDFISVVRSGRNGGDGVAVGYNLG